MPKLSIGTGSRVLMCHGRPPLCRGPHDSANDNLELKLRPVGQPSQAHAHVKQSIRLYDPHQHHALAFRYGNFDPGACSLAYAAWTLWLLGYPDQALERSNQALTLAQNLEHPYTLARSLYWTSLLHQLRRE